MVLGTFRITYTTAMVLEAVAAGYRYGFDVMEATGLPSGTVYPALRRLERDGHLASAWEDEQTAQDQGRPARRYYRVTTSGQARLGEARRRFHGLRRVLAAAHRPRGEGS